MLSHPPQISLKASPGQRLRFHSPAEMYQIHTEHVFIFSQCVELLLTFIFIIILFFTLIDYWFSVYMSKKKQTNGP